MKHFERGICHMVINVYARYCHQCYNRLSTFRIPGWQSKEALPNVSIRGNMEVEESFSQFSEIPTPLYSLTMFLAQGGRRGALPQGTKLLLTFSPYMEKKWTQLRRSQYSHIFTCWWVWHQCYHAVREQKLIKEYDKYYS